MTNESNAAAFRLLGSGLGEHLPTVSLKVGLNADAGVSNLGEVTPLRLGWLVPGQKTSDTNAYFS